MPKYEELNKALNRSLRVVDKACHLIVDIKSQTYESDLNKAVDAVGLLKDIQKNLYKIAPEYSWHFEENESDTPFMSKIRQLLKDAGEQEVKGNIDAAKRTLHKALELVPPPIQCEVIEAELRRLKSSS